MGFLSCRIAGKSFIGKTISALVSTRPSSRLVYSRYLSSLGSPMFPERAVPELADLMDQSAKNKKKNADDDDFLSNHGGKLAIFGFSLAIGLVYRWVRNGSNKNDKEREIRHSYLVDPAEISDLRHSNSISGIKYLEIINGATQAFPSGFASYSSFILYVKASLGVQQLSCSHILDRIVLNQYEYSKEDLYPVGFLLTAFSTTINERADVRIGGLYQICRNIDKLDGLESAKCTMNSIGKLVDYLVTGSQIPAEKQVAETGNNIPFKTFRQKTSIEMFNDALEELRKIEANKELKLDYVETETVDENVFRQIIESAAICVWGQCYKPKSK